MVVDNHIHAILDEASINALSMKEKKRLNNREIIKRIIDVTKLISRAGIALRGHNESKDSLNRGNFLEIINWVSNEFDSRLDDHLNTAPKNAQYTSPTIQNEVISILESYVKDSVVKEVLDGSGYFLLWLMRPEMCLVEN